MDAPSPPPAAPAHLRWGVDALLAQLHPALPGIEIEVVPRLDSTNTRLLERARLAGGDRDAPITRPGELDGAGSGMPATPLGRRAADLVPGLLVAEEQTAGRGRLGRGWSSAPGRSLTFSLGLPMAPAQWGGLSLAVGVALAEALEPEPATPRLLLKWPNDLWLRDAEAPAGGRKLGGVLIETVAVGRHRRVVVGVGLNVLPLPPDADAAPALAHGHASLHEIDAAASAPKALAAVALPLARALRRFEHEGFAPFEAGFAARDLLRGRAVAVQGGSVPEGVADGVDAQGALRVRAGERVHLIVGGEASVRVAPPPPGHAA
ncbi:MAG: biotin--[acetyl-CoA-carboxylase] ligase [Burkholderiaceae bacterium]|nr:biotin--[acetyl-CoA-carboxylase] ligase [Burkholderiaceae bacterium]